MDVYFYVSNTDFWDNGSARPVCPLGGASGGQSA